MPNANPLLDLIYDDKFDDAAIFIKNDIAKKFINMPGDDGELPIHAVTDFGQYDDLDADVQAQLNTLAILLIKYGASLHISHEGMLPIHYVCTKHNGSVEVLEAILEADTVDQNVLDAANLPALYYAVEAGNVKQIAMLEELADLKCKRRRSEGSPMLAQYQQDQQQVLKKQPDLSSKPHARKVEFKNGI